MAALKCDAEKRIDRLMEAVMAANIAMFGPGSPHVDASCSRYSALMAAVTALEKEAIAIARDNSRSAELYEENERLEDELFNIREGLAKNEKLNIRVDEAMNEKK